MNAPFRLIPRPTDAEIAERCQRAIDTARETAALYRLNDAALRQRAAESARQIVAAGAARAAREPWRITRAIFGGMVPAIWPYRGMTAVEMLAECARRLAAEERRGRESHWTFDANRLIALRQAEAALLAIIMDDVEPDPPEAA